MDKNRGRKGVLAGAAELFDLPADVVAGLPHVEVVGNREFYMENHRGILSYGGEEIGRQRREGRGAHPRPGAGAGEHDRGGPAGAGDHRASGVGGIGC